MVFELESQILMLTNRGFALETNFVSPPVAILVPPGAYSGPKIDPIRAPPPSEGGCRSCDFMHRRGKFIGFRNLEKNVNFENHIFFQVLQISTKRCACASKMQLPKPSWTGGQPKMGLRLSP